MKTVAIHQPFVYPWPGYVAKAVQSDAFVFLELVQFQHNQFMRRNYYRTPSGKQFLSVPCAQPHRVSIVEVRISDHKWVADHIKTFEVNYRRAPFFDKVAAWLFPLLQRNHRWFVDLACEMLVETVMALGVKTDHIYQTRDLSLPDVENSTQRLVDICVAVGGETYITGSLALNTYLEKDRFVRAGMGVQLQHVNLEPYPQVYPGWSAGLMMIDMMMNIGAEASLDWLKRNVTYEDVNLCSTYESPTLPLL